VAVVAPTATREEEVMSRSRLTLVFVTAALLILPTLATAQEEATPLTWVGMMHVKPGSGPLFEKAFEKYNKPYFDKLVADGSAISWGLGYEMAGPGGYDYVVWITVPGWAGIGAVESMFDARYEEMSEEELMQMIEEWMAVIEPGKEETQLLEHKVFKAAPDVEYKYLRLSAFTVKPGHDGDFMKLYKSFWAPVYEELLETGVIAGYGMIEQAVHSDSAFTHESWITFNDLSNLTAVEQAFEKVYEEFSSGEGVALESVYMKIMKPGSHFDRLIRVWKRNE
jgi:hypothetical protein